MATRTTTGHHAPAGTPVRRVRVPDGLWTDALDRANSETPPRNGGELVRDLLAAYVGAADLTGPPADVTAPTP